MSDIQNNRINDSINNFLNLPAEMKAIPNWLVWRLKDRGGAKPGKKPYCARGGVANVADPSTFSTFDEAVRAFQSGNYAGIGFVFTGTPFVGIDIDGCYDEHGRLSENAIHACDIAQSFAEISQSGRGLHIIMKGSLPTGDRRNTTTGFEMYGHGSPRYFAMTGNTGGSTLSIREHQAAIDEIYARYVAKSIPAATAQPPASVTPAGNELTQNAAENNRTDEYYLNVGLAKDTKLIRLYNGERPRGNESSDDIALMNKLAYWCNCNKHLMWDAFRRSPHYAQKDAAHREKCNRDDYLRNTIEKATAGPRNTARVDDANYQKNNSFEGFGGFENGDGDRKSLFQPLDLFEVPDATLNPGFPTGVLPDLLRRFSEAISVSLQVSVDMPAVSLLTVISLCAQGKFMVQPKKDWKEPVNLYTAIIAAPSERKSAVQDKIMQAIHDFVSQENEQRRPAVDEYRSKCNVLKKKVEALSKAVAEGKQLKNLSGNAEDELRRATSELTTLQTTPVDYLTLVADDITTEALADTMAVNDGKMGIVSTEGGVFQILGGLYSSGAANLDIFLKAFSGDFFQVNRMGRRQIIIPQPTLTVLLMFQPSVLNGIMGNGEFRGRGLLARFLYSIPTTTVGNRKYNTPAIDPALENEYEELIHSVLCVPNNQIITFSPEADAEAEKLFNDHESRLGEGDLKSLGDWAGKHHGRVMRIAAILHIVKHCEQAAAIPVSGDTVARARVIGDYFIAHAINAFQFMGAADDKATEDAKYILKRISTVGGGEITKRDLYQLCKSKFRKTADMQLGLEELVRRGYIAICKETPSQNSQNPQNPQKGGRPTEKIFINPLAMGSDAADVGNEHGDG